MLLSEIDIIIVCVYSDLTHTGDCWTCKIVTEFQDRRLKPTGRLRWQYRAGIIIHPRIFSPSSKMTSIVAHISKRNILHDLHNLRRTNKNKNRP